MGREGDDVVIMRLQRSPSANDATIGDLTIEGEHQAYTCEDVIRLSHTSDCAVHSAPAMPPAPCNCGVVGVKVPGKTAIPAGMYRVIVNRSERFSRLAGHDVFLPLLLDVPRFDGVRIHTGNRPEDTEGCVLVGLLREPGSVGQSLMAFKPLAAKIIAATQGDGQCWIDVRDPVP